MFAGATSLVSHVAHPRTIGHINQCVVQMNLEQELRRLKDEGHSKTKAAAALGMTRWKLEGILEVLAIDWPKQRQGSYEVNGLRRTLEQHASKSELSPSGVRRRLLQGQDIAAPSKIVPVTEAEAARFVEMRRTGMPAWEAAQAMGRPYNTLKNAAKKFVPDYDQVVASAPRIRRASEDIDLAS